MNNLILVSREDTEMILAHGAILCTPEEKYDYLMHYRTKDSKNGIRRFQNKDGSLTPEGYQHYKEMYGWGKKVAKAERLQDKADRLGDKAAKADLKRDRAVIKDSHRAIKTDISNAKLEKVKTKAAVADAKASVAQNKATKYADKLDRLDRKMQKYVNEDGSLKEKALNKYTYETGIPGERKMSLLGRLKFGNEFSNKFNKDNASKMSKEERTQWEASEKKAFKEAGADFDGDVIKMEADEINSKIDHYRMMSDKEKIELGNQMLSYINDGRNAIRNVKILSNDVSKDLKDTVYGVQNKLVNLIDDEVGSIYFGDYKQGTKAEAAEEKSSKIHEELRARENAIRAVNGFKSTKKLKALLEKDSTWRKLNAQDRAASDDVMGAILQDLGFADTPANRSIIWSYGWFD